MEMDGQYAKLPDSIISNAIQLKINHLKKNKLNKNRRKALTETVSNIAGEGP